MLSILRPSAQVRVQVTDRYTKDGFGSGLGYAIRHFRFMNPSQLNRLHSSIVPYFFVTGWKKIKPRFGEKYLDQKVKITDK